VAPNETVDISVDMTAPETAGNYTGYWILRNAANQTFQTSFFVQITVGSSGTGTQTPGNTATPSSGSGTVTNVTISVDNASYTGECPHTFNFTAEVTLASAARVTLQLEAGADTPGYEFRLPPAETLDLGSGTSTFSYSLSLTDSVEGWARVRVTSPNNVTSNQAAFSLTCQ
jgi:hypothetical protein